MNAPPPTDPQLSGRLATVLQYGALVATTIGGLWVALEKVAKPYSVWRAAVRLRKREEFEAVAEKYLGPHLAKLNEAIEREHSCADRMEDVFEGQQKVLLRQEEMFNDLDTVLHVVVDNRERLDETNAFLDALGFSTERRTDEDQRREIQSMVESLIKNQRDRRRMVDE